MIRRTAVFRRKLRGYLLLSFFSLFIFAGVFSACMGMWYILQKQNHLISPIPKVILQKKSDDTYAVIQTLCEENHLHCTNIQVHSDTTASLFIDTDEQVILSLQKDLATQIASLQLTIAHLTIDGRRFRLLDFRFDKPVISY